MRQRSRPGAIQVRIHLRSGAEQQFEICEGIYQQLDQLVKDGADGFELCKEWLPPPMVGDPPVAVHVAGTLQDGTDVDVSFGCKRDAPPKAHYQSQTPGGRDMSPD